MTGKVWVDVGLISRTCHEANRAICEAFGDFSQKPWEEAEQWQRDSTVKGIEFAIDHPDAPHSAQHEAWIADKQAQGWVYGPVKNEAARTHPSLVPYERLTPVQQAKYSVFKAIVRAMVQGIYHP